MITERNIPLPTVVASYLAFIQLIVDGTEASIPWHLVRDDKNFTCLKLLLESVFLYTVPISTSRTSFRPWKSVSQTSQNKLCDLVLDKYEPLRIVVVYLQKRGFEKNANEILACLQLIVSFQQIAAQERRIPIVSNHA